MDLKSLSLAANHLYPLSPPAHSPLLLCANTPSYVLCFLRRKHADSETPARRAPNPSYTTSSTLHCEQGEITYFLFNGTTNTKQVLLKIIPIATGEAYALSSQVLSIMINFLRAQWLYL